LDKSENNVIFLEKSILCALHPFFSENPERYRNFLARSHVIWVHAVLSHRPYQNRCSEENSARKCTQTNSAPEQTRGDGWGGALLPAPWHYSLFSPHDSRGLLGRAAATGFVRFTSMSHGSIGIVQINGVFDKTGFGQSTKRREK